LVVKQVLQFENKLTIVNIFLKENVEKFFIGNSSKKLGNMQIFVDISNFCVYNIKYSV
jgi:hypothetical protein